jgi:cell wall-associated NlpC family hydrolase
MRYIAGLFILFAAFFSCHQPEPTYVITSNGDTVKKVDKDEIPDTSRSLEHIYSIETGNTSPEELISFANTLKGIPYKYGSVDPREGFDCSGFVTYVFNHFNIKVPRTSFDFSFVHRPIELKDAKAGDLILFTGTDSTERTVGHMGIILSAQGQPVSFIHSTSGKAYGVTETPLNSYYMGRYMHTIRIFPQNDK